MAANAADAAAVTGLPGELSVWTTESDGRHLLHVANTGEPLTASGVRALAALRASNKHNSDDGIDRVGRFGVGFTAVATVADRVEIRSTSGSILFDATMSGDAAGATAPMLRLPWPTNAPPATGFDTEVLLRLIDDCGDQIVRDALAQAAELLLCLPTLHRITVAGQVCERSDRPDGDAIRTTIGDGQWWQFRTPHGRWVVDVSDGAPRAAGADVLYSPTRTDISLTLPFRLIADLPVTPDRRGLDPDADPASVARGYADLASALPPEHQLLAIPDLGFPASAVDGVIRSAVIDELSTQPWLLPAHGTVPLVPQRAELLVGLTDELAAALGDGASGLVHPDHSSSADRARLVSVGVSEVSIAEIVDRLRGTDHPPKWWRGLYEALAPLAHDSAVAADLGALPVPLASDADSVGAMAVGPRSTVVMDPPLAVPWLPVVHPQAWHPLLERLGAQRVSPREALADDVLRAHIDNEDDGVVDAVLRLAADTDGDLPGWLGGVLVPTADGDDRPADELLVPGSPLAQVLIDDHPFGYVAEDVVETYGRQALTRIGAGWTFTVVTDDMPTSPDHNLPDEATWWDSLESDPVALTAIRDLDLVDEGRWPQALAMLVENFPQLLADRNGYTAWWLRNFAEIDGRVLGEFRSVDDVETTGLFDVVPLQISGLDEALGSLYPRDDADSDRILAALADRSRAPSPAVVARAHSALAQAFSANQIGEPEYLPPGVRTVSGVVVNLDDALVVDAPWMLSVCDPDRTVVAADVAAAPALAKLLDLPLTSEALAVRVISVGRTTRFDDQPAFIRDALLRGAPLVDRPVTIHDELRVEVTMDGQTSEHRIDFCVIDGHEHRQGSSHA